MTKASAPSPGPSASPDSLDAPTVLRELAWVIHRTAPERSGGPLPTTEVALLKQVLDSPGLTVGELAAALGLRQPNASAALRALEQRGFIEREKSAGDRRVSLINATPAGAAEHAAISDAWKAPLTDALRGLSAEELAALGAATPVMQKLHNELLERL